MKIATWNIERLKHKKSLDQIVSICESLKADIIILTESDGRVRLNYKYCFQTPTPPEQMYKPTEHRISVFTNYNCVCQHTTCDKYTALCIELETEKGNLLVYGTIIGIYGNRQASFKQDLLKQEEDYKRLAALGNLCVCGDFNCGFADNYYFTKFGRDILRKSFFENRIKLLTENAPYCIDHIAVSEQFLSGSDALIEEWNQDKTLSDHKGIAVSFE